MKVIAAIIKRANLIIIRTGVRSSAGGNDELTSGL